MFEDALMESGGQVKTRSRWTAIVSATVQLAILAAMVTVPLLYPAVLPVAAAHNLLLTPPAKPLPNTRPRARPAAAQPAHAAGAFTAPRGIPNTIHMGHDDTPPPAGGGVSAMTGLGDAPNTGGVIVAGGTGEVSAPAPVAVRAAARSGPLRISSGVAAGARLSGAAPVYPAMARAARIYGHVIVEATISRSGSVENLQAVSGPPLLRQAALDAVRTYRYRPYTVSGEAVETSFTVDVNFTLER